MSAAKLADRTVDIGFGISRSVVADLETGRKKSIDVPELLVLAAALGVSPAQLLYPDLPKGPVEILPGLQQESHDALRWFSGEAGLMKPSPDWTEAESGESVGMWVREQFDPYRRASQQSTSKPCKWPTRMRAGGRRTSFTR
jgi:transcriptional regulator with XRE-family HTH domain